MDFKQQAASTATTFIKDGQIIGLGAGVTIVYMVDFLFERIQQGLKISVLTSSSATKKILLEKNIPVLDTATVSSVDMYFDGCDQFDKNLDALKSGGGIHTQEKLLASMAKEFILVGDDSKYVDELNTKFPLVVEVIPEAKKFVERRVKEIFGQVRVELRMDKLNGNPLVTQNNNLLFDIWLVEWPELSIINSMFKNITGVLETSLFYRMAHRAVIAGVDGVRTLKN
jgi:ribose 5-phosphate isomerase A